MYEVYALTDQSSSNATAMIEDLVDLLRAKAEARGHLRDRGPGPRLRIYLAANTAPRLKDLAANSFFVNCRALFDDTGTYQEPPAYPYEISWCDTTRSWVRDAVAANDPQRVRGHFSDFLDATSSARDDEARQLEVGRDKSQTLTTRRRALGGMRRTETDPWPTGLKAAVADILDDVTLPLFERIEAAYDYSAWGDLFEEQRRALLLQASQLESLPPKVEISIASEFGGASAIERLGRLTRNKEQKVVDAARSGLTNLALNKDEPLHVRRAAFAASTGGSVSVGHVFVSYVSDDSAEVEALETALEVRGVRVWRAPDRLLPGERWKFRISEAIRDGHAFLAVFSKQSESRDRSYMRQELIEAVEELCLRPTSRAWFFPVLLSECELPDLRIGPGETLRDLQFVPLYESWDANVERLATALKEALI